MNSVVVCHTQVLHRQSKLTSLFFFFLTLVLSWFPQQDPPLRFRCGYQPWAQAVSGGGGTVSVWPLCHLPATSHGSAQSQSRACLHVWHRRTHIHCHIVHSLDKYLHTVHVCKTNLKLLHKGEPSASNRTVYTSIALKRNLGSERCCLFFSV